MPRNFWMPLSLVVAGLVFVLFPDKQAPLISFNSMHGPSALDLVGLLLFAVGWIWLTVLIIIRWKKIRSLMGKYRLSMTIRAYLIGIALIILGLRNENEYLLWIGVFFSSSSNLLLILKAASVDRLIQD